MRLPTPTSKNTCIQQDNFNNKSDYNNLVCKNIKL